MLSKRIKYISKLQIDDAIAKIRDGMGGGSELFTKKIMNGNIYGNRLNAYINPPRFISDPFRSKIKGLIEADGTQTKISLKVSFGAINILVLFIWYIPMISVLQYKKNQNLESILIIFGMCSALRLLCLVLLTIKLG